MTRRVGKVPRVEDGGKGKWCESLGCVNGGHLESAFPTDGGLKSNRKSSPPAYPDLLCLSLPHQMQPAGGACSDQYTQQRLTKMLTTKRHTISGMTEKYISPTKNSSHGYKTSFVPVGQNTLLMYRQRA